ncbi:hypothetical protein ABF162_25255 (plasmid) [Vibrio coralliilyticus]|uniref:hypothetical protein n=1 Tax=Vibrio coralliilyticus TaxID=190893 RepID=UPI000691947E|nr:hypothetical protein [Vibrio coralliilyticus]
MAKDFPFPPKSSAYWIDNKTTSYDNAVAMFDAQNTLEKKMMRNPVSTTNTVSTSNQQTEAEVADSVNNHMTSQPPSSEPNSKASSGNSSDTTAEPEEEAPLTKDDSSVDEFMLGWYQVKESGAIDLMWDGLLTPETPKKTVRLLKKHNKHLNSYVNQGEIVVLPTVEPKTEDQIKQLEALKEEAKAASVELGKLLSNEVAALNRHFDLLAYKLEERVKADGLPSDYYAQVSAGVGATSALVEQNLKNIQGVLFEINDLYTTQVAMASRTGGINYGSFVSERAALFKKLDGSFAMLSKSNVQIPAYVQVKRNLKLSTKSVVHNADEILKSGVVPNLGKRIANISMGMSAARGIGYIGVMVGATSGLNNIYDACQVDSSGNCGKTVTRETSGFLGSLGGGTIGGSVLATGAVAAVSGIALLLGVTASAPVLAIAAIGGYVTGGFAGGVAGATAGKAVGDVLYDKTMDLKELSEDTLEQLF